MRKEIYPASLNIKLDEIEKSFIKNVLGAVQNLPSISTEELLKSIKIEGINSKLMYEIFRMLTWEEKPKTQTYLDSRLEMTIAVGLDIQPPHHSDAKAVMLSVNPHWDFEDMQHNEGRPNPPLTPEEIKQIFYYTLIGATYEPPRQTAITFIGKIQNLIHQLEKYAPGLSEKPFKAHELVCLVSMAFNNPALIGKEFCKALVKYKNTGNYMDVLLQIMEGSNKLYDDDTHAAKPATNGLQNRRMLEAALFCGEPEKVHISYRQYKRIEAALATLGQTVISKNGNLIYSQPYGNNEIQFKGGEKLQREEITYSSSEPPFVTYYGSHQADSINVTETDVHPIVFSGSGNNTIRLPGKREANYPYLIGGNGSNHYELSSKSGQVIIYDNSGHGKITIDGKHVLQGIALATEKNTYQLSANGRNYKISLSDTQTQQANINWGDSYNHITLPNFQSGHLKIILGKLSSEFTLSTFTTLPKLLPNSGNFVVVQAEERALFAKILTPQGQLIRIFPLMRLPDDEVNNGESYEIQYALQFIKEGIAVLENNNFVVIWGRSVTEHIPNDHDWKEVQQTETTVVLCSEIGIIKMLSVALPDGKFACELVTTWVTDESGTSTAKDKKGCEVNMNPLIPPQIFSKGNGFVILHSAANIHNDNVQKVLMCCISGNMRSVVIEMVNGYDTYFLSSLASLANGNFVIGLSKFINGSVVVSTHILNAAGQIIRNFSHGTVVGFFAISLTPVSNGYMLALRDTQQLSTMIFNGHSWSKTFRLSSPTQMVFLVSGALKNDYTLVSWGIYNDTDQAVKAIVIDPNNEPLGDATTLASLPGLPVSTSFTKQEASLTIGLVNQAGISFRHYTLLTSTLPLFKNPGVQLEDTLADDFVLIEKGDEKESVNNVPATSCRVM